jgi:endonuclease YncB( thermonuclease family)
MDHISTVFIEHANHVRDTVLMVDKEVTDSDSSFTLGIEVRGVGRQGELSFLDLKTISILRYRLFHRELSSPVKNIRIIRNCRVDLRGLLFIIGAALGFINFLVLSTDTRVDDFSGRVVGVSDGDTITVMHDGQGEKIRLYGIDAPEKGQAFGNRVKQFVSTLAFGKEVKVEVKDRDRYGRTVADVILPDGRNLHDIVKAGFVWWYRRYAPKDKELESLESEARATRRGLWADPHPVPPWEWRKRVHAIPNRFESDLLGLLGNYMGRNLSVSGRWNDFLGLEIRFHLVGPTGNDLVGIGITNTRQGHQLFFGC